MSKTDIQLKKDIEAELSFDPMINAAQIEITAKMGAVTLVGAVDTFAEKWAVEIATKRVGGVRTVAQDLRVKLLPEHVRDDAALLVALQTALTWDVFVPKTVTVKVRGGSVTLAGEVNWHFQRDAAERAVRYLAGVRHIANGIILKKPQVAVDQLKETVKAALQRQAPADGKAIRFDTAGGVVTLTGNAPSWRTIEDAKEAAWSAHGVTSVVDQMTLGI